MDKEQIIAEKDRILNEFLDGLIDNTGPLSNAQEYRKRAIELFLSENLHHRDLAEAWDEIFLQARDALTTDEKVKIRNPYATRPWQHVLEPLSGYLMIGQKLLEGKKKFADSWNFGPSDDGSITVKEVVENIKKYWDKIDYDINKDVNQPHEANL
jgi:hypothetical protein